ncbi:hypothetical protein F4815DRAFT_480986 [Daldinia loculata]|nr:hypothetical protein F4815DRAFT_480986 [Daldinia loculata]
MSWLRLYLSRMSRRVVLPASSDSGTACTLRVWLALCSLRRRMVLCPPTNSRSGNMRRIKRTSYEWPWNHIVYSLLT